MGFEITNVTWEGPPCDDAGLLASVPAVLRALLEQDTSGFIQFHGGLHYRGACRQPRWHSLRAAWLGPKAIHKAYPSMSKDDIPFAQDYLGNQYILRDELVMRVMGETGEVGPPIPGLAVIDKDVTIDPPGLRLEVFIPSIQGFDGALDLDLLDRYLKAGQTLEPGDLMHVYPPMCSREAASGIGLRASTMKAQARLDFLTTVAGAFRDAAPGTLPSFPLTR
jgi:hypothetical protein